MRQVVQTLEDRRLSQIGAGAAIFCGFLLIGCADSRSTPQAQVATPAAVDVAAEPAAPVLAAVTPVAVEVTPSDRVAPKRTRKALSPDVERALATVDPDRVFKTAPPDPNTPSLTLIGSSEQQIPLEGTAELAVQGAPESLVTFATSDGGVFANNLASITVLSDEQGIARVEMRAPPGTVNDVPVMIGSPNAQGTLVAIIHVLYAGSSLK